jgi:replicative DNA helicase
LGLYRDTYYKKGKKPEPSYEINKEVEEAEIIILKNRDGRIGTAYVSFEGRCTKFMNKKEEQPLIIEFEK